ncbi:MAG: GNAT family N-acetyltransferase [Gammaproteobacteria bacterium]|nr:GNAT family N-acetyltransferase [Gammaproteobacteria bacterium]MCH9764081.1 GNAT family N-acetyltransferase [Gammaproteobacteria bacterium]
MIFVARDEKDQVIGYVQWIYKSGFRKEAVIELEQIAVVQDKQGQGVASKLIKESLTSPVYLLGRYYQLTQHTCGISTRC